MRKGGGRIGEKSETCKGTNVVWGFLQWVLTVVHFSTEKVMLTFRLMLEMSGIY